MKIKISLFTRKIRNQLSCKTTIFVEREDGSSHEKTFITNNPDISKAKRIAKGQAYLFLKNITQNASVVEFS
jgi:hypothetical protein